MKKVQLGVVLLCLAILCFGKVRAQELDPKIDYRLGTQVVRDAQGRIKRNGAVLTAFKKIWPCPSTGKQAGACPGWAIDHVIPLGCGGKDAVYNLQWLPDEAKSSSSDIAKDRFERKVYGGHSLSKGCP